MALRARRVSNASGASSLHDLDGLGAVGTSSATGMAAAKGEEAQELGSMYDYLAKVILLGPSGSGKSCILHRFLRGEWRALSSHTIGVEFGSKIVAVGSGARRTRIKLQLWDTAGTERFRAVSRSYYRGAAGALLVYDVASYSSFAALPTFLRDAKALASPRLSVVLVGNKVDVDGDASAQPTDGLGSSQPDINPAGSRGSRMGLGIGGSGGGGRAWDDGGSSVVTGSSRPSTRAASLNSKASAGSFTQADSDVWALSASDHSGGGGGAWGGREEEDEWEQRTERGFDTTPTNRSTTSIVPPTPSSSSGGSMTSTSTIRYALSGQQSATQAPHGREVDSSVAANWASTQKIAVNLETSALSGEGVDDAFRRLAQNILTKIELGEIDPDDPQSGIQYGDAGWWDGDDGGSIKSSGTAGTLRRRKNKTKSRLSGNSGLREWEAVFRLDRGSRRRRTCC